MQVRRHPEDLNDILKRPAADRRFDASPIWRSWWPRRPPSGPGRRPSRPSASGARPSLEEARLTSAVELYGPDGVLVSRFALNFPEAEVVPLRHQASGCEWTLVGEVQPFGADERRMLHAERDLCVDDGTGGQRIVGAVVAYVMLDYSALSFISSQSPYLRVLPGAALVARGHLRRRRRADGVRLGPAADLHVPQPLVAAHRRRLRDGLHAREPGSGPSWPAATASTASSSRTIATASTSSATRS